MDFDPDGEEEGYCEEEDQEEPPTAPACTLRAEFGLSEHEGQDKLRYY